MPGSGSASDSVWKWLATLFGGIIIGFLIFWFGGGQSQVSVTAQTAAILSQVQKVQDAQEQQIDNVNGRMEAMANILSELKQEVHDDEQIKGN